MIQIGIWSNIIFDPNEIQIKAYLISYYYCNTDHYSTYKINPEFQTIVRKNDGFL